MSLTLEDRAAIQDLLARYMVSLDEGGGLDTFIDLFTEDPLIEGPQATYQGAEGLREFVGRRVPQVDSQARHLFTNMLIEGGGDDANISVYYATFRSYRDTARPTDVSVGTYECAARRVRDTWRLQRCTVHADAG